MNRRCLIETVLGTAFVLAAGTADAEQLIAQFSGDSSEATAEFSAAAPWLMDWRVTGEPGQYEVVSIDLVNAITGSYEGKAVKTKTAGNGVRLFDKSGRFYFRVDSSLMGWNIKVIQLTSQEAGQYKPKE